MIITVQVTIKQVLRFEYVLSNWLNNCPDGLNNWITLEQNLYERIMFLDLWWFHSLALFQGSLVQKVWHFHWFRCYIWTKNKGTCPVGHVYWIHCCYLLSPFPKWRKILTFVVLLTPCLGKKGPIKYGLSVRPSIRLLVFRLLRIGWLVFSET